MTNWWTQEAFIEAARQQDAPSFPAIPEDERQFWQEYDASGTDEGILVKMAGDPYCRIPEVYWYYEGPKGKWWVGAPDHILERWPEEDTVETPQESEAATAPVETPQEPVRSSGEEVAEQNTEDMSLVILEAYSSSQEESAGCGVLDTGATRCIGSALALTLLHEMSIAETGEPCFKVEKNIPLIVFKFGNGKTQSTCGCISLWICGVKTWNFSRV